MAKFGGDPSQRKRLFCPSATPSSTRPSSGGHCTSAVLDLFASFSPAEKRRLCYLQKLLLFCYFLAPQPEIYMLTLVYFLRVKNLHLHCRAAVRQVTLIRKGGDVWMAADRPISSGISRTAARTCLEVAWVVTTAWPNLPKLAQSEHKGGFTIFDKT